MLVLIGIPTVIHSSYLQLITSFIFKITLVFSMFLSTTQDFLCSINRGQGLLFSVCLMASLLFLLGLWGCLCAFWFAGSPSMRLAVWGRCFGAMFFVVCVALLFFLCLHGFPFKAEGLHQLEHGLGERGYSPTWAIILINFAILGPPLLRLPDLHIVPFAFHDWLPGY